MLFNSINDLRNSETIYWANLAPVIFQVLQT